MAHSKYPCFVLYASGNFGKSCLATFVEIYALFFFTDVLGISPAVAGAALLASLVWDALTDPLLGWVADQNKGRWSTFTPYALIGAPLTSFAFLALFSIHVLTAQWQGPVAITALMAFRTAYTIIDVPHNSLLGFVGSSEQDRTTLASFRIFFSAVGKLAVTIVAAYFLSVQSEAANHASGFAYAAIVLAILFTVSIAASVFAVKDISFLRNRPVQQKPHITSIFKEIARDHDLRSIFLLTAINSLITPVIAAVYLYYAKYGLGDETLGAKAVTVLAIAQALSLLFWTTITNFSAQKKNSLIGAYAVLLVASAYSCFALGAPFTLYVASALSGFAMGGLFMLNWSMLPDALERSHSGSDIGIFGAYTLTNKIFHGLAQAYLGFVLAIFGFHAGVTISEDILRLMLISIFALPLTGALICMPLTWNYRGRQNNL